MPTITFKAKVRTIYNMDNTPAWQEIPVPTLTRSHTDMAAWRKHPKFGGWANSDMFPAILNRQAREVIGRQTTIRLDNIPAGVTVDTSGFLAVVTIEVA